VKLAIGQINPWTGAVRANLAALERCLADAVQWGAHVVAFPAFALSGWRPGCLAGESWFLAAQDDALRRLAEASDACTVIAGHASRGAGGAPFGAAAVLQGGRVAGAVSSLRGGGEPPACVVEVPGVRLALGLGGGCNIPAPADLAVWLDAKPFHVIGAGDEGGAQRPRGAEPRLAAVRANLVGGQGEFVFGGAGDIRTPSGDAVARCAHFSEDLLLWDSDEDTGAPLGPPPEALACLVKALELGLADFVRKSGFRDVVLGVSGGVDSAVVATLAARALGPDHVVALTMPTRYSSPDSGRCAETLCANLGLRHIAIDIDGLRTAFEDSLAPVLAGTEPGTAEQNVQARIRATLVMAYSNKHGALPLATGNRSEGAMGYCTLYGDTAGALAPIGDLPKTAVYEVARFINRDGEVIPDLVLKRAPSAELAPGQTDQDDLPPYDLLDRVLGLYLDEGLGLEQMAARGIEPRLARDVVARVQQAAFKRAQEPPVLRVWTPHLPWPDVPLAAARSDAAGSDDG
jgi:NAD+ synthase (glutamine-hydrolysing)